MIERIETVEANFKEKQHIPSCASLPPIYKYNPPNNNIYKYTQQV